MKQIVTSIIFISLLCSTFSVYSIERDRADRYCKGTDFTKPIRQTIVLIDENSITEENNKEEADSNRKIIQLILNFSDPTRAQQNHTFLPREQILVFSLPRDATEPNQIFIGCQPFYSEQEIKSIEENKSLFAKNKDIFFGTGKIAKAKQYEKKFIKTLAAALVQNVKTVIHDNERINTNTSFLENSFISSLQNAPRLVNLSNGIPRIIIISDFSAFSNKNSSDILEARTLGFSLAKKANINFSRAEIYAVTTLKQNKITKEFVSAFFLGSGGLLSSWSSKAISNLSTNPVEKNIFKGTIDYASTEPPVNVRLVWDSTGRLVNSWIEVSLKYPLSTPLFGSVICEDEQKCKVVSDNSGFAQIWSINPDAKAEYKADMPFSGLRRFEISINKNNATGKIWDPAVNDIGGLEFLSLELIRQNKANF